MATTSSEMKHAATAPHEGIGPNEIKSDLVARYETVQAKAKQAVDVSEDFVKSHPFYTVLGAATVGFVAGFLLKRRQ